MAQTSDDVHPVVVRVRRTYRDLQIGIYIPEPADGFQTVPPRRHAHIHKSHGVRPACSECCPYPLESFLALQGKVEFEAWAAPGRSGVAEQSALGRCKVDISVVRSREDLTKVLVNLHVVVDDKYAAVGDGARTIHGTYCCPPARMTGSSSVNVAPVPGPSLRAVMVPAISLAASAQLCNPNPCPFLRVV